MGIRLLLDFIKSDSTTLIPNETMIMLLMMTLSKWSLRVCYHFSQGQVIYSNLATVTTVILWSWAETVTLCSPSTVWDDNSSTMVKQANFVNKLSSNYFHSITRWRATVTLRSLSRLSLRRSVRFGTGDSTRRPHIEWYIYWDIPYETMINSSWTDDGVIKMKSNSDSLLSLRRSVRSGTGDSTRRGHPPHGGLSCKEAFMKWWN